MRAVLFGVLALAIGAGAAQAQEAIDQKLVDAGFTMRSVDTPKQMERAKLLPHRQIISRTKDGKLYYLYADVAYCKCVLVGSPQALQAYRDMSLPPVPMSLDGPSPSRGIAPQSLLNLDIDPNLHDADPDGDILDPTF
ncbi:MAG: hypothetical protein WDO17_21335 [Alphaproteobacteria bacterium]